MPSTTEFDSAYKRLNIEQKSAVDAIDGPVFVIAGPGTGKTQILTLRVANILRLTDTAPESILALTFTEAGVSAMRSRLSEIIGARGYRVRIHTFHGFAESLIARYPDAFPRIVGGQIATDVERAEMLDEALLHADVEHLRPFGDPLYYHGFAGSAIATMKRENVTPHDLRERIVQAEAEYEAIPDKVHAKGKYVGKLKGDYETLQKKIVKTHDLLAVYEAYEAELTKRHRYDYEDLILEAVRALRENESFRREVQESIFYVHADEHQDANRAQNALLELLVEHDERPNLFVVGDEKQAIYRFQGADLDNVHYFRARFPETKIIALVANYRSNQTILDTALSLITASPDERMSRVKLEAHGAADDSTDKKGSGKTSIAPFVRVACNTPMAEMDLLATEIKDLLEGGADPEEIAVLCRRNQDVSYVADSLIQRGIQVGRGTSDALHNRFVAALIRLLRGIESPRDEALGTLFTLPGFMLSGADVWRIMDASRRGKVPAFDVISNADLLKEAKVNNIDAVLKLRKSIDELIRQSALERPAVVAQAALNVSGILDAVLTADDRSESLAAIRELLGFFEELSEREHDALLPRALQLLQLHEDRGIALTRNPDELPGLVRVMTVHRAKGREYDHVYVPRLTDRAWSTRNRPEHFYLPAILSGSVELEDERRLLYVAITRARHSCALSYATTREDGKDETPSALISEIDPALVKDISYVGDEGDFADELVQQAERATKKLKLILAQEPSADDLETLRRAFYAQGLSPTAFNNYLQCPWKYFYVNLLRIPEAENKFMLFGTAIHNAIKVYADRRGRNEEMSADELVGSFNRALSRAPLTERDIAELKTKGERALTAWWNAHKDSWPTNSESELPVDAKITLNDGSELIIRGKLDRVDEIAGGVSVIDYKTGKPKTRNELMGKTKDADGNYYRQLQFYKLLLATTETPRLMTEGVIEFVEPDEKGTIRTERFEITDAEVSELQELIKKSAHEILTLSFWSTPCDDADCQWCPLRFGV